MKIPKNIFLTLDLTSLTFAFSTSIFLRQSPLLTSHFDQITYSTISYIISFIVAVLLLLAIFSAYKLYQIREIELSARIFTTLKGLVVWVLLITAITYILKYQFSRGVFGMTIIITTILICAGRYFFYIYRRNKRRHNDEIDNGNENNNHKNTEAIILGTGFRAESVEKQIIDTYPNANIRKLECNDSRTLNYLKNHMPADIFLADEKLSREKVLSLITDKSISHHSFRVISDTFKLVTGEVRLNDIDEIPSITIYNRPHKFYMGLKRLLDIIMAGIGIVIASPLWLIATILIKLESKGPALIRQIRIGYNSKPFTLYKFRTMRFETLLYEKAPMRDDDERITKIGRILRRLSIDELPQLWNILMGNMTLVGPRPEMEFIVRDYCPWQKFRLLAKPGLTGLWQILGRKDIPLHENLEYDFYYVCNRSIILDLMIILKTIPAVLFGRGAY